MSVNKSQHSAQVYRVANCVVNLDMNRITKAGQEVRVEPRVMDVLNSYLRAVEVSDLEDPSALISLRAQMLRRIQLVTGEGRVRDLLIMEFVLS